MKSTFKSAVIKANNVAAEKVPLKLNLFQPIVDPLSPEKQEIIAKTKETLEKETFVWGAFPIVLPESQLETAFAQVKVSW